MSASGASYVDSSSLLKLLWDEPESGHVRAAVAAERTVIVSALAELEVEVQLRARMLGGSTTKARYRAYRSRFAGFRDLEPFEFRELAGTLFRMAIEQHAAAKEHCRTADRLHLTAMNELGVRRLLTNDAKLAQAARALGHDVMVPAATHQKGSGPS